MNDFLQTPKSQMHRALQSTALFLAIYVSSLAFVAVMAAMAVSFGASPSEFRVNAGTFLIVSCVSLPLAFAAALSDYRLHRYRDQLQAFASTDPLTGLLNRRFFQLAVAEEMQRMQRTGKSAALVLFDLDHFKTFNDTFGHQTGDCVLQSVADSAQAMLREPFDKLGRWGGEEFAVLISEVDLDQAVVICERLRKRIEKTPVFGTKAEVSVTASFGVTLLKADDRFDEILDLADSALYAAKESGRNMVRAAPHRSGSKNFRVVAGAGPATSDRRQDEVSPTAGPAAGG